jgi:hypothetical protein
VAVNKKKRASKTSKGVHGAKRHKLTEVQKVNAGKGLYESFAPIGATR